MQLGVCISWLFLVSDVVAKQIPDPAPLPDSNTLADVAAPDYTAVQDPPAELLGPESHPATDYENRLFEQHDRDMAKYNAYLANYNQQQAYSAKYNAWANRQRNINQHAYKVYAKLWKKIVTGNYNRPPNAFLEAK
eukprot:gnl/MRDRNA2_/MRDRNA2_28962_c0_seq1.p1 gnl/MRDRNA2_/MRDRNA2_28962_c0~~gnl/MRDRNA2_/MRDRNA2_28962_c0_seq1.p1  ORF type:complete len:136 (+),score=18.93 gnl/MRDRNA2_/MRDRNA2_28962_c0_seq1:69-476(+)